MSNFYINLDISKIPFSRYGAYIALFDDRENGLSVHWPMRAFQDYIYKIYFFYENEKVIPAFRADAVSIRAEYKEASALIYIKNDYSIVIDSSGFEYEITPVEAIRDVCYGIEHPYNRFEVISYSKHFYATTKLYVGAGQLLEECSAPNRKTGLRVYAKDCRVQMIFHLSEEQEDFKAVRIDVKNDLNAIENEWADFAEKMPEVAREHYDFALCSWYNLWSAVIRKSASIPFDAILMSKKQMCAVWSWDHCFNALALAESDVEQAYQQFVLPFYYQSSTGALPDLVSYNNETYYGITKPPVHGWAFSKIWNANPQMEREKLQYVYDVMKKQTDWWFAYRDSDGDGIPDYPQGCDSGADNGSNFLELGYFIESPDLPAYLILQMQTLAGLADALGLEDSLKWEDKKQKFMTRFLEHSLEDGYFVSRKTRTHECNKKSECFLNLMPLVLGDILDKSIRDNLICKLKDGHLTSYGISSESYKNAEYYRDDGYWQGPIWAPTTYLLIDGLKRGGEKELAREIAQKYIHMVVDIAHGNYENFDAKTGKGLRAPGYTWTASVTLLLMRELFLGEFD